MLTVGDKLPSSPFPSSRAARCPAGRDARLGLKPTASGRFLFYWPKDFTFVCPTEISAMAISPQISRIATLS
jgi:alkyl hydroperoxide reductase subunit AhpC